MSIYQTNFWSEFDHNVQSKTDEVILGFQTTFFTVHPILHTCLSEIATCFPRFKSLPPYLRNPPAPFPPPLSVFHIYTWFDLGAFHLFWMEWDLLWFNDVNNDVSYGSRASLRNSRLFPPFTLLSLLPLQCNLAIAHLIS